MRGRKPKPARVKLLHGKAVKPPASGLVTHGPLQPASRIPPEFCNEVQRELWHQVVSNAPEGLLRKIDEPLIFAWVAATATHQIAQAELAANGYYHRSAKSGYRVSSPAIGVANRAASMMAKIASELGFSPSARARLSSPPVAADKMPYNPFDKFKD